MKELKKLTSIILCIIMVFTAMHITAFATDEPYIEIKFVNEEKDTILLGETEEFYIDYSAGNCENYEIVWEMSNPERWKTEYVTDEETGLVTGAIIEGEITGYFILSAKIIDGEGDEIASTKRRIEVIEPRTTGDKISDFFRDAGYLMFFTTGFIILPMLLAPVTEPIYFIYIAIKFLITGQID